MAFRIDLHVTDSVNVSVLLLLFLLRLLSDSQSHLLLSQRDSAVMSCLQHLRRGFAPVVNIVDKSAGSHSVGQPSRGPLFDTQCVLGAL